MCVSCCISLNVVKKLLYIRTSTLRKDPADLSARLRACIVTGDAALWDIGVFDVGGMRRNVNVTWPGACPKRAAFEVRSSTLRKCIKCIEYPLHAKLCQQVY